MKPSDRSETRRSPRSRAKSQRMIFVALLSVILAACSGTTPATSSTAPAGNASDSVNGGASSSAPSESTVESVAPLKIALAATGSPFAQVFVAQAEGYFKDQGLDVTIIPNASSTGVSLLTSGQTDLFAIGPGPVFSLNKQGKHAQIIYNIYSGGAGAVEVRMDSDAKSLMDLSGKRVGSLGIGGSSYGFARVYSKWVESHGGQPFTIVPFGNQATLINGLLAGQVDATVDSKSWFATEIKDGKAKLLVDTSDQQTMSQFDLPDGLSDGAIFGLADNLAAKQESVIRFLVALQNALEFIHSHSPQEIAAEMKKLDVFAEKTQEQVELDVASNVDFVGVNNGEINEDTWPEQLKIYGLWGMKGINATASEFPYAELVNMDFLNEALDRLGKQ